jgi:hypothetical protein
LFVCFILTAINELMELREDNSNKYLIFHSIHLLSVIFHNNPHRWCNG